MPFLYARRASATLRCMNVFFQACPPGRVPEPCRSVRAAEIPRLPSWIKWVFTSFMVVWVPVMFWAYGVANILWLCEVGNLLLVLALWLESRLLLSALLDGLLLVDLAWGADLLVALASGVHPFGATDNMFDLALPLPVRLGSLFHLAVPPILLLAVGRLGYDRRGFRLQVVLTGVVLAVSYLVSALPANINWVLGLGFGVPQPWISAPVYLLCCMVAYPVVLYLPVHLAAVRSG